MKKKLLIALMATTATLCCTLGLTACFGNSESGNGSGNTGHEVMVPIITSRSYRWFGLNSFQR